MSETKHLYDPPAATTLIDLLSDRTRQHPDQVAYHFLLDGETEEARLTYRDLDHQARAIAARLHKLGTIGEPVLLLYPPGLAYIAAFFGCLYAGMVAVPAFPPRLDRPGARLQSIVIDAQPRLALTTRAILSGFGQQLEQMPGLKGLRWLATDDDPSDEVDDWQAPKLNDTMLAFLQYTSGSTMAPRGVQLTHGNLLHNLSSIHRCFAMTPQSRGLIWLPPYHDMGLIGGILQPLYSGFPVTLLSPLAFLERPLRWLQAITRTRATISGGPNFAYELCVRKISPEARAGLDLSSWQVAFNGAEPIRAETLERFAEAFGPRGFRSQAFYPCYGLAEATLLVSGGDQAALPVVGTFSAQELEQHRAQACPAEDQDGRRLVSSGQPLPDQQVQIVDSVSLTACSPDQVGEIWISGPSVARGYWNQPAATEQTFGAYLAEGAGPFLRTGDLGFLRNNELFITGRLKDLIIIRGRNYYPQDIEFTVEKSHRAVRPGGGAVLAVDVAAEERLVVVQELERQAQHADVDEVASAIRRAVAEVHELHVYAVVLIKPGSLPKTSSGKVQRQRCRELFLSNRLEVIGQSVLGEEAQPQREDRAGHFVVTALQAVADPAARQTLVALYLQEQVAHLRGLPTARVDQQQPLSTFGLDSLMAVELKDRIEATFGVVVPMTSILQGPTLTQLAATVLSAKSAPAGEPDIPASPAADGPLRYPLSPSQRGLWFLYQLAPDSAAYCIPRALHIRGRLDTAALQRAFAGLIERHSTLRTVFRGTPQGDVVQEVLEQVEVFFQQVDASSWSDAALQQRLTTEARRPFDLERGPVLRVYLFARSPEEHVLLITVHHIVMDFWSVGVFVRELQALYQQEVSGVPAQLATLPLQYRDYVDWQAQMLQGSRGEQLWSYWRSQLAGELPVLQLPSDQPPSSAGEHREAMVAFKLPDDLSQQLRALAHMEGTTLYMALLTAFLVLLYHYTEQEDILVGSATAGRERSALRSLVGYFVNPVVLRARLAGDLRFTTLLDQVRQMVLEAFEYQDFPFIELVDRLKPKRDPNRPPLFQVMFTFQQSPNRESQALTALALGQAGAQLRWGDVALESMALEGHDVLFDLLLLMAEVEDTLTGAFQYDTGLFSAPMIERMAGHFQALLEGIAAHPERPIAGLSLLTPAEYQQVIVTWNSTQTLYPQERLAHELFEDQVARTPGAIALVFDDRPTTNDQRPTTNDQRPTTSHSPLHPFTPSPVQHLTYDELNTRANRLARYLSARGVGPEVAVGLFLERSPDLIGALLGVLKAGGFYVPLDPTYPPARLAYMVADAGVTVVLTLQQIYDLRFTIYDLPASDDQPPELKTQNLKLKTPVVVCLDTMWNAIAAENDANPTPVARPENLAYMIYTSGSTGQPKGTMIVHSGLVNYLTWCRRAYPLEVGRGVPVHSSIAFDLTVTSTLAPLIAGQPVVLLPEAAGPEALAEAVRGDAQFSLIKITPAHLKLLGDHLASMPVADRTHAFVVGGEPLLAEHIAFWRSAAPSTALINEYGPTETVVGCCVYTVTSDQAITRSIPIGRPIQNTQLYILDRHLRPVPIGVVGELYIGGAGVARGYFQRPDLTAERFVPNPFAQGMGDKRSAGGGLGWGMGAESSIPHPPSPIPRLYRTGDLARYRADGMIECLGRVDRQVKLRGFRVELGEIEAALVRHPDVREALVLLQDDQPDDQRLVAYVVPKIEDRGLKIEDSGSHAPDRLSAIGYRLSSELRDFLKEKLPGYMVPSSFVVLDALPLLPNGKVDLAALRKAVPEEEAPAPDEAAAATYTAVEQALVEIWKGLLRVEQLGIHDNFFDLGGHSFLVFQMQHQIREQLQCSVPIMDFLNRPTISALASYIEQQQPAEAAPPAGQQSQARAETRLQAMNLRRQSRQNRK